MGISNFFYEGARLVKGFVKAQLNVPKPQAGESPSPDFRQIGKAPSINEGYRNTKIKKGV